MTARKRGPKSTAAGLSALAKVADGRIFAPQSVQACCNPCQSAQRQAFFHLPAAVRKNFDLGLQGPAKDFVMNCSTCSCSFRTGPGRSVRPNARSRAACPLSLAAGVFDEASRPGGVMVCIL